MAHNSSPSLSSRTAWRWQTSLRLDCARICYSPTWMTLYVTKTFTIVFRERKRHSIGFFLDSVFFMLLFKSGGSLVLWAGTFPTSSTSQTWKSAYHSCRCFYKSRPPYLLKPSRTWLGNVIMAVESQMTRTGAYSCHSCRYFTVRSL